MSMEFEVKFLNINPKTTKEKLRQIGATQVFDKIYKRRVFDYSDLRLDKQGAWLRLRDEGDKITLTFKQRLGIQGHKGEANDQGMEEIEITVSDFEETTKLLKKLGFVEKFYEENRRIRFVRGELEFDIDFWPLLDPYLEIEAPSEEKIEEAIKLLGLKTEEKRIFSTNQIYHLEGIEERDYQILTFEKQMKKNDSLTP